MPEFVGFQTMGILVPYGITFDAVGVFGLTFDFLLKICLSILCIVGFTSAVAKNWRDHWLPSVPPALRSTRKLS